MLHALAGVEMQVLDFPCQQEEGDGGWWLMFYEQTLCTMLCQHAHACPAAHPSHAEDYAYHDFSKPSCDGDGQPATSTYGILLTWGPDAASASPAPQLIISGSVFRARDITPVTVTGHAHSELAALTVKGVDLLELNSVRFEWDPEGPGITNPQGLVENHGHGRWAGRRWQGYKARGPP